MSEDLKARLIAIAPSDWQTVQESAQDALYTFVEDYEDGSWAQEILARNEPTILKEELEAELAPEDRHHENSRKAAVGASTKLSENESLASCTTASQ